MPDKLPSQISPTGEPIVPPAAAKYLGLLVAVAAALMMAPDAGVVLPAAVLTAAKLAVLIGTVLGIYSPGARKEKE